MPSGKAFYDVCVSSIGLLTETCQTLVDLGYRTIAINQVIEEPSGETKKKKKKGETEVVPELVPPPICLQDIKKNLKGDVHLLNRLTFSFSEHFFWHKLNQCRNLKKYHLLAAIPTTPSALQLACSSLEVDIISFDPEKKCHFRMKRKQYYMAVDRGLFFELSYVPAILDSTTRKIIIQTALMYRTCGKSKNVIISSGASHPFHVRGPYDIINLGLLLALTEEQANGAITEACRKLILRGEARRYGKAVTFVSVDKPREAVDTEKSVTLKDDEMEDFEEEFQSAQKKLKQAIS